MTRKLTEPERLECQLIRGQYRVGPEAARDIARRITDEHGFWDFKQRRRRYRKAQREQVTLTLLPGGQADDRAA